MACDHHTVTSTSDADTSGSFNSLETRAPESDSHSHESGSVDSISSAMDTLLIQPHVTKWKAKPGYNSSAVCITNASFIQKLSEEQKKKRQKKQQKNVPRKGRKKELISINRWIR